VHLAVSSATREREGRAPAPEELESERTLERQVAALEALLERFLQVDSIESRGDPPKHESPG
jgi:hypothetical protein